MHPWNFPLAFGLLLFLQLGCLIIPYKPTSSQPGQAAVKTLGRAEETRASLHGSLGAPTIVNLPSVAVWEWEGDQTNLFWLIAGPGGGGFGSLDGPRRLFRVLARFEGDRVTRLERDMARTVNTHGVDPEKVIGAWWGEPKRRRGAVLQASVSLRKRGGAGLACAGFLEPDRIFTADAEGGLWRRGAGPDGGLVPLLAAASPAPADASTHLAIDSSGRFLALGHHRKLRVWDCVESRLILDLAEPRIGSVSKAFSGIQGLAFAPDGRSLAVVDDSASVVVDVTSWLPAAWCAWEGEVSRVSFSPDGRRLVIQGQRLQIFDPSTGFLVAEVPDASAGGLVMEGHRLLVAGTVIQVVDLESGRELGRIKAATTAASATLALRLAADGVLSIYRNETLERWSLPELERGFREGKGTLDLTESADSSALLDMRMIPISPASLFPWYTITERLLSPDGAWLVDRWHPYLQILSAATLKPAGHIRLPEYHGGIRIGFTKDSQLFVLGPDGISLWNLTAPKVETVSGSK